jgi:DNA processing protein
MSTGATYACDDCLRRTDLIAALAGRLDIEWRKRDAPSQVLALDDAELLALGDDAVRSRWHEFRRAEARRAIAAAGLSAVCRCSEGYPEALRDLSDPPAVVHVAGRLEPLHVEDCVGIVGARAATAYGLEVARELGRTLAVTGVGVVSGLALGIDATAHEGAILALRGADAARKPFDATGTSSAVGPVAVLAGGADRPYPARGRRLYAAVRSAGAVVSEMPPGFGVHRWAFVARNRIIAALSRVLVVVEAAERSGSLTTADFAVAIGRTVAAVPGRVTSPTSRGTNGLIHDGAPLVRGAADVLDLLAEVTGSRHTVRTVAVAAVPALEPAVRHVLELVEAGHGSLPELASSPDGARAALRALGELEARGLVVRGFGGRYERAAR